MRFPTPLHLGLTGGIGSGKSTVALMLQARGAALIDADAWALGGYVPPGIDANKAGAEKMEWLFERFEARQRQIAAVLGAHGLEVTFDHCPVGKDARAVLRS